MGKSSAESFFGTNYWVLRVAGLLCPHEAGRTAKRIFLVHSKVAMGLMIFYGIVEWMGIQDAYEDNYNLSKCATVALAHTVGIVKEVFTLRNNESFKRIMAELESRKFWYESCEERGFNPESIFKSYKTVGSLCTSTFLIFALLTAATGCVPQCIAGIFLMRSYDGSGNYTLPKLPYFTWTPIEPSTWCEYFSAVIYQCLPLWYHSFGIIAVDTLCVNIMNCVAMNLAVIKMAYCTIRERCTKRVRGSFHASNELNDGPELKRELKMEMRKICQHLQSIYRICDDLENMNKYVFLFQTLCSLFGICSSLYLALTTPLGDKRIYAEFIYLFTLIMQLMLYCWFGNEVKIKAAEIPLCIWESDWISMDNSLKQDMILTMARANVPLLLTAGKFVPLTLGTFMQVIKGSYSFYAFMRRAR